MSSVAKLAAGVGAVVATWHGHHASIFLSFGKTAVLL